MFNLPVFYQPESHVKPTSAPLFCWDIANPDMERRIQIHQDMEQMDYLATLHQWQLDSSYKSCLKDNCSLVITNLSKEIIWASRSFQSMTGYEIDEIMGKKPSFLQGKRTNQQTRQFITEKLSTFETLKVRILNYRKSGETYWCGVSIAPIRNSENKITHFIAIEKEVN